MTHTMTPLAHLGRAVGILAGLWALSIPATLAALASACRTLDADDAKMAVADDKPHIEKDTRKVPCTLCYGDVERHTAAITEAAREYVAASDAHWAGMASTATATPPRADAPDGREGDQ